MLPQVQAKYIARLFGAPTWEQNKNSGNWQIAVPFEVTQGEHAGETITWIGIMHDTADKNGTTGHERVIQSLQYMGWQGDDISELAELTDAQAVEMMPNEVSLSCAPDTYEGKTRLKVQWVNKAGGDRFAFKEPATKNDLKSFAAQMKATVRSARGPGGARPANGASKPTQPTSKPVDPNDIPF